MTTIEEVWIGRATPLKRVSFGAKGRASIIQKRRSHLFIRFAEQQVNQLEKKVGKNGRLFEDFKRVKEVQRRNRPPAKPREKKLVHLAIPKTKSPIL